MRAVPRPCALLTSRIGDRQVSAEEPEPFHSLFLQFKYSFGRITFNEPYNSGMSALSSHLDRLLDWLDSDEPPPSQDIRIVEINQFSRLSADGTYHVRRDELQKPLDYETRFDELLRTGYTWLNMSCYGVHDDLLIVAIEVPRGPRNLYPGCPTSVNLSGPRIMQKWNLDGLLAIE
jgi:hypothetical protein